MRDILMPSSGLIQCGPNPDVSVSSSQDPFLCPYNLNSRLLQEIQRPFVRVGLLVDYLGNAGIDHHLGAEDAGLVGAVERCPLDADAVQCRLNDGILLGMHRPAQLVARARGHALPRAAHQMAMVL